MTLVPILLVSAFAGWLIYRDATTLRAARRYVRIDYAGQRKRRHARRF